MPNPRSALLNMDLPADLSALVRAEGVRPERAWLLTSTDLNLAGGYEEVFLIAEPDRLVTVGGPADGRPAVRISLRRKDIRQIRTRRGVGGGFLEALASGVFVEIVAYSNARADLFRKVAAKLKAWIEAEQPDVGPADDDDPRKCPKCGLALEFKGDICRRCVDRGAVLVRVVRLMRPYAAWAAVMFLVLLTSIGLLMIPPRLTKILVDQVIAPKTAAAAVPLATRELWLLYLVIALVAILILRALCDSINGPSPVSSARRSPRRCASRSWRA